MIYAEYWLENGVPIEIAFMCIHIFLHNHFDEVTGNLGVIFSIFFAKSYLLLYNVLKKHLYEREGGRVKHGKDCGVDAEHR